MTSATATGRAPLAVPITTDPSPRRTRTVATLVAEAGDIVADISLDDARWGDGLGHELTAFVDAARDAAGRPGSPIGAHEAVAPVLRLRDLADLAQCVTGHVTNAPAAVEARLRSLQVATVR